MKESPSQPEDVQQLMRDANFDKTIGYIEVLEHAEADVARARWPHLVALSSPFASVLPKEDEA